MITLYVLSLKASVVQTGQPDTTSMSPMNGLKHLSMTNLNDLRDKASNALTISVKPRLERLADFREAVETEVQRFSSDLKIHANESKPSGTQWAQTGTPHHHPYDSTGGNYYLAYHYDGTNYYQLQLEVEETTIVAS